MSSIKFFKGPAFYVRWTVNTGDKSMQDSCNFRFQGALWHFRYRFTENKHYLDLHTISGGRLRPFGVTFYVEDNDTGRILPKLSRQYKKINFNICKSWTHSDMEESNPGFCWTKRLIFLVELKTEDMLIENNISRETQNGEHYLPGPPTTSASVQTDLNMSNFPCLGNLSEDFDKLLLAG